MNVDLKDEILSYDWERWLNRNFSPFYESPLVAGIGGVFFERIGFPDFVWEAVFYQRDCWYESNLVYGVAIESIRKNNYSVFDLSNSEEKFYPVAKRKILSLVVEKMDPFEKLKEVYEILCVYGAYVWLTHGFEEYYKTILGKKFTSDDEVQNFLDGVPILKKTAQNKFEEGLISDDDIEKIHNNFKWITCRSLVDVPMGLSQMKEERELIKNSKVCIKNDLRNDLTSFEKEISELIYFRTRRTDSFYEFQFLARPLYLEVANELGISLGELEGFFIWDLLDGKKESYSKDFFAYSKRGELFIVGNGNLIDDSFDNLDEIKGVCAYNGKLVGRVKVVDHVSQMVKVKKDDVLVTQMTFPAYLPAMRKASAFVTDEGGLTCHAAIVAREMKKPCIIGTKNATKVLKDGDLIEVDAIKGVVRKIK